MDVAELVPIGPNIVTEAALIQLHMVYIVEDLEFGKPMSRVVSAAMRVVWRKFPHVVRGDIQGLQVHQDAGLLGEFGVLF